MANTAKRQPSIVGGIFKFFGFVLLAIAVIVVGFYCYLKFALGIDLIDIKKKLDLINLKTEESQIVTNPYQESDAAEAFTLIFNNEDIYKDNGEGYVFDKTAFSAGSLVANVTLTDKQFASLINVYMKNLFNGEGAEDFAKNIKLKQVKFTNFEAETETTKVDMSAIAMLDFAEIKKNFVGEDNFIAGIISSLIPDSLYINCNFKVIIDNANPNNINVENNYVLINQLTKEQSNEIFNFINNFMGGNSNFMADTLTKTFTDILFGSDTETSIFDMINGFSYFTFESDGTNIYLSLKK